VAQVSSRPGFTQLASEFMGLVHTARSDAKAELCRGGASLLANCMTGMTLTLKKLRQGRKPCRHHQPRAITDTMAFMFEEPAVLRLLETLAC
jgi:homogentisate 1,2-dioxygenase